MSLRRSVLGQVVRAVAEGDQSALTDRELLSRFNRENDQAAFASLVQRHGGMVLGVCRRTLPRVQDAEDACQATFLVLARKAGSVSWGPSVANWLYVTARKVARNARIAAERRARREAVSAVREAVVPADELSARELLAVLDEELGKLPSRYREPLILCYLEGLTRDEAAERVGVPVGTIKSRLERGRKKLGDALTRRGVALGAGLLAIAVGTTAGAFSPRLAESIRTVVSGTFPAFVCHLAGTVGINSAPSKLLRVLVTLIGVVGVGIALGAISANPELLVGAAEEARDDPHTVDQQQKVAPEPLVRPIKRGENPGEMVTYRGRVLGPDAQPVPGAKLHVMLKATIRNQSAPVPACATADKEGRFEVKVPKEPSLDVFPVVIGSTAPTHGAGWVEVKPKSKCDDLTIRLVGDNAPITGQIVTLEGQPVVGATLTVVQINAAPKEDLRPWLEAVKARKSDSDDPEFRYFSRFVGGMSPRVTTDNEGRFKLRGIGPNRLVFLRLEGPTIATRHLRVLTRAGEPLRVLWWAGNAQMGRGPVFATYYGTNFRYPAAPTKPIIGVVRDKDTKKPLVGVTVRSNNFADPESVFDSEYVVQTTTDKDGRYRLVGMPSREGNRIAVIASTVGPYLVSASDVPHTPGLAPATVDFELKRGIWIEGKITDKATGQPLWADVEYFALAKNPNLDEQPGFARCLGIGESWVETKADGSYRIAGLPGPGFIVVGRTGDYLNACERDDEFGRPRSDHLLTLPVILDLLWNYDAIAAVEPKSGVDPAKRDVTLDPGWTFRCRLLGPDGKPLAGVRAYGVSYRPRWTDTVDTGEFTVRCFNPRRPRDLIFQQPEKGLVGVASPPKENGGVVTVQMERAATVTGRLLGVDGKPRPNVGMRLWISTKQWPDWEDYAPPTVQTDKDGRFRIEGLVPGFPFMLWDEQRRFRFGEGLRSGVAKDLGDVRVKEDE